MYKQIIIARKDLNMSPGKLAAQVSHGSMSFLTSMLRDKAKKCVNEMQHPSFEYRKTDDGLEKRPRLYRRQDLWKWSKEAFERGENYFYTKPVDPSSPNGRLELCEPTYCYEALVNFDEDLYEQWIQGEFTKCVLKAKNKNQLLKAKTIAEELGMKEDEDFWLIRDNCHTELEPEEDGKTLTVIGFKPMDSEIIDQIGKKYQLYI